MTDEPISAPSQSDTQLAVPDVQATTLIRKPADVLAVAGHWLDDKQAELARAEAAVKALTSLDASPARRRLVRERVKFLRRFVKALRSGYVPIPRFDADKLDLDTEELPAEALVAMADVKTKRLFDEIRYVTGRRPDSRPGGHYTSRGNWSYTRLVQRDPLIVGIMRTPEHRVPHPRNPSNRDWDVVIPSREEAFLIAWWRPEDTLDVDLF
jgi:hypothetical protein